ncbi:hypothetical protein PCK1_002094 [Pneumocystis canis]|nr:hypothetical protein PCK1_002094 [Pneumocystis canis]
MELLESTASQVSTDVLKLSETSINKASSLSSPLLHILSDMDMCIHDGKVPQFYNDYVKQVQEIIQNNARLEFEAIWRENQKSGKLRSILSDELSSAITRLNEEIQRAKLWDNIALRHVVLKEALPSVLLEKQGLDTILELVPESYIKATFGSFLASRFIYQYGADSSKFSFFEFMNSYLEKVSMC